MELEEPTAKVKLPPDARPFMLEPPKVRLIAIADMALEAPAWQHGDLVDFYVGLLKFERDDEDKENLAFKAEKFRLVYRPVEAISPRDDYRAIGIETPLINEFVQGLIDREIAFQWQKGTAPGIEVAFLQDPAGYWVSVGPIREVR